MSNIFNLMGGIGELDKGQVKPMEQYKICHDIRPNSTKTMGTKLKGLSIRSNSDMNVSQSTHPATVKKDMYNKEQDFSKLKITQVDTNGCHISPTSEKKLCSKFKECTLKEEIAPMPAQTAKFSLPEKLAYWHDSQHEFDYGYIDDVEKEFQDLFSKKKKKKKNITSRQEKMLISEPSTFVPIPELISDTTTDEEEVNNFNDDVFKKPMPFKSTKSFPEPEKLAWWHDAQYEFDYGYIDTAEKEFQDLFSKEKMKQNIISRQEKMLISEPSTFVPIPELITDTSIDEEAFLSFDSPEISDISDDEM